MSNETQRYTIKQIGEDLVNIDKRVLSLLEDHEARLQALESADVRADLRRLLGEIQKISDVEKRNLALACFTELIDALGIKDLEAA